VIRLSVSDQSLSGHTHCMDEGVCSVLQYFSAAGRASQQGAGARGLARVAQLAGCTSLLRNTTVIDGH
jgi:hypothetical protein